jgi:hypothetical protein
MRHVAQSSAHAPFAVPAKFSASAAAPDATPGAVAHAFDSHDATRHQQHQYHQQYLQQQPQQQQAPFEPHVDGGNSFGGYFAAADDTAYGGGMGGGAGAMGLREASHVSLPDTPNAHEYQPLCACVDCQHVLRTHTNYSFIGTFVDQHLRWEADLDRTFGAGYTAHSGFQVLKRMVMERHSVTLDLDSALPPNYPRPPTGPSPQEQQRQRAATGASRAVFPEPPEQFPPVFFCHLHCMKNMTKKTRDFSHNAFLRDRSERVREMRNSVRANRAGAAGAAAAGAAFASTGRSALSLALATPPASAAMAAAAAAHVPPLALPASLAAVAAASPGSNNSSTASVPVHHTPTLMRGRGLSGGCSRGATPSTSPAISPTLAAVSAPGSGTPPPQHCLGTTAAASSTAMAASHLPPGATVPPSRHQIARRGAAGDVSPSLTGGAHSHAHSHSHAAPFELPPPRMFYPGGHVPLAAAQGAGASAPAPGSAPHDRSSSNSASAAADAAIAAAALGSWRQYPTYHHQAQPYAYPLPHAPYYYGAGAATYGAATEYDSSATPNSAATIAMQHQHAHSLDAPRAPWG